MKITDATCLLELQQMLRDNGLDLTIEFVQSIQAWRATINYPAWNPTSDGSKLVKHEMGVGRTIGEAIANAYNHYKWNVLKEAP